jgi:hypothetical protein
MHVYNIIHQYILSKWLALRRVTSTTKPPTIGFWNNVGCIIVSPIIT